MLKSDKYDGTKHTAVELYKKLSLFYEDEKEVRKLLETWNFIKYFKINGECSFKGLNIGEKFEIEQFMKKKEVYTCILDNT